MKKLLLLVLIVSVAGVLTQCNSSKKATGKAAQKVTYTADIQPIIAAKCTPCHFPDKGRAKALNTYDAVKNNADEIIRKIQLHPGDKGFMPMKRDRLSDSTINLFQQWKGNGLAE
jgi:uncharacterized membrane protein